MLLTKEVEVKIGGSNKQYYIDKGYDIPTVKKIYKKNGHINLTRYTTPRGTKIIVKIEDLLNTCEEPIYYQCDNCNEIFHTTIYWIRNRAHNDGKLYCTRCACKIYNSGENCHLYKHDKTDEERILGRSSRQDYEWKLGVLQRDRYLCFKCKTKCKSNAVAHHLDGYNWCKEKRYDITNGVCLCQQCHSEFHNIYGYGDNTQKQFEEWLDSPIDNNMLKYYDNVHYRQYYCLEDNEILFNLSYLMKIGKIKSPSKVRKCCKDYTKTYCGKHYVFYEDYLQMTQEQINTIINNTHKRTRQVVCVELNLLFDTIKDASRYIGTQPPCIIACCKHRKNTARGYHWLYVEDYKQDISKLRKVDMDEINRKRNTSVNSEA